MTHALLLSGGGRYADPWHPFRETSAEVAGLLETEGMTVEITDDVDAALASLSGGSPDLLVVNVGLPRDGEPSPGSAAAREGLHRWARSGAPLLALHSSSTSFTDSPVWETALGGRWVRGTTMHPDYGPAQVLLEGPLLTGVPDFTVDDERYSRLRTAADVLVHARHLHDGILHPLIWSHERASPAGRARTFYDALGHDATSYSVPEHREVLRRGVSWLLGRPVENAPI
jgi:type 1 glutamine amidotransferase